MMPSRCVAGGTAPAGGQKQKFSDLCNFFSIRDSLPPRQSENRPLYGQLSTFSRPDPRFGATRQSLIAKKLQSKPIFCFQAPWQLLAKPWAEQPGLNAIGGAGRMRCCRQDGPGAVLYERAVGRGAADEAPQEAVWSRFHRRPDAMAPSASNAIAATTVP